MTLPWIGVMVGGPACGTKIVGIRVPRAMFPVVGPDGWEYWWYRMADPLPDGSGFYYRVEEAMPYRPFPRPRRWR